MIKVISPANRHPTNRAIHDFHRYWAVHHGPLYSNTRLLRRYVQHLTLPESYRGLPEPTYDGASMFWFDDIGDIMKPGDMSDMRLRNAVRADDAQLFDREPGWPTHHKRAIVFAEEKIVVDGETTPTMVKAIFIASRLPGLQHNEFFKRWYDHHGALGARVPGLRRYVQNHAILDAYKVRPMTHDGWSEVWFDDLAALRLAIASPEWGALREDGKTLFAQPMGVVVARELVQKSETKKPDHTHIGGWGELDVRAKLAREGYKKLAADPRGPASIIQAAKAGKLALWTDKHLVTTDYSAIDTRPEAPPYR